MRSGVSASRPLATRRYSVRSAKAAQRDFRTIVRSLTIDLVRRVRITREEPLAEHHVTCNRQPLAPTTFPACLLTIRAYLFVAPYRSSSRIKEDGNDV